MKLSDSHNQSETNNPPKFSQILKNCNKLIAKNIASAERSHGMQEIRVRLPAEAIFFAISLLQFLRFGKIWGDY